MDVIQGGKFTKNRAVSLVNDLKQVDRACGMLQEKLGFVLEYVEDVLVSIFTVNLYFAPAMIMAGALIVTPVTVHLSVRTCTRSWVIPTTLAL